MNIKEEDAGLQDGEFLLSSGKFEKVQKTVARLNKKTVKKGGTPSGVELVREVSLPLYQGGTKTNQEVLAYVVRAVGSLYTEKGYKLVASLEHTPAGNIIRKAPGFRDFDAMAYRFSPSYCSHCNLTRGRKNTFILEAPGQGHIQVGRNCLADFLRSEEVETLLGFSGVLDVLTEASQNEPGSWAPEGYSLDVFVATAYRSVRLHGFRKSGEEGSTKSHVLFAVAKPPYGMLYKDWEEAQPTAEDFEGAKEIKAFVEALEGDSDYVHNLKVAFARGFVPARSEGLVASAAGIFFKDRGEKAKAKKSLDEHFGEPKKRYDLELTVTKFHSYDTAYGAKEILIFTDAEGREFMWNTSPTTFEVGDKVQGKGTIKEHGEYKGRKQTELSRCKFTVKA